MFEILFMRNLVFILLLNFNYGLSQNILFKDPNVMLSTSICKQRMDSFWNLGLKKRIKNFEIGTEAGIGIEKNLFQQTFSPHLEIFSFYNVIQNEASRKHKLAFGPGIILSGTTYINQTRFNYGDLFFAYQFCIGQRWKFFHQGGYGFMSESFVSNGVKIISTAYNYCFKLGLSYAFDF